MDASSSSSSFTCEICFETIILSTTCHNKFHHGNITSGSHNFCINCISSYIQSQVGQNIVPINCPDISCDKTLDPLESQSLISFDLFIRWCDCLANLYASGFKKSYCPYPDCLELILNECDDDDDDQTDDDHVKKKIKWSQTDDHHVTKCSCPRCKRLFCYECRVPWHAGYWCSESGLVKDSNDIEFGRLIERMNWIRCPDCGQTIERPEDCCRRVICRCGKWFCQNCGRRAHFGNCRPLRRRSIQEHFRFAMIMLLVFCFMLISICVCDFIIVPSWLRRHKY